MKVLKDNPTQEPERERELKVNSKGDYHKPDHKKSTKNVLVRNRV